MSSIENIRKCMREPIPEIEESAQLLSRAVSAHIGGDFSRAGSLFHDANMSVLWEWLDSLIGEKSPYIQLRADPLGRSMIPKESRVRARMPNAKEKKQIHERDGYTCRFCGIPVIRAEVRRKISRLYPDTVPWGKTNVSRHFGFLTMWAQYDHILPHARGGDNSIDNLILTCTACNFGRMSYTLEEVGLRDPRTLPYIPSSWDGLESFE